MKPVAIKSLIFSLFILTAGCESLTPPATHHLREDASMGRVDISTIPLDTTIRLSSATYTPSGKVLVAYYNANSKDIRDLNLAVMDDDGSNMRTFFSQRIPNREKDNGIRYMVFADNQRIFMGDFVLECTPTIDNCDSAVLSPVQYPEQIADGNHIAHRWSEIIIAPDNEHLAWTTLFSNYSAAMFTGKFVKESGTYKIINTKVISTLNAFRPDPQHPDGVLPNPVRNGEVKQFIKGGTAISLVGAQNSDLADSVVQYLNSTDITQITHAPGYDETTIFSPDEKLGIVMSTRFSEDTDLKILGLMPKPYPASLNIGLNMHSYIYSVSGVRKARSGNIGPVLIDINASTNQNGYLGTNLHTQEEWVYESPMSWHPNGKKAMWLEAMRGADLMNGPRRIQVAHIPDYTPEAAVTAKPATTIPYAINDLSTLTGFLKQSKDTDVKVYGRHSGHIEYRRTATGKIEKVYNNFSDDGENFYKGSEKMQLNPSGHSTYIAKVTLSGPNPGLMNLKITFGSLQEKLPAKLIFAKDEFGVPLTHGYTEYKGKRLTIQDLVE